MRPDISDARVRLEAFAFLDRLQAVHGEELPIESLRRGFVLDGLRVPLMGPQGIFKPGIMQSAPLSMTTTPEKPGRPRPYDDEFTADGFVRYRYRGTDPEHHENRGLRRAMRDRLPLIYFHGIAPGRYVAAYPAFVVRDDPAALTFTVAVDDQLGIGDAPAHVAEDLGLERRRYITATFQRRLHQAGFRERVLRAYRSACTICRLRHLELLDASHIVPDRHPQGAPVVSNGLALCKIHHAAFDRNILGISGDLEIHVRRDILEEEDGPMLRHGIQELHGLKLAIIPRRPGDMPNPELLALRFERFRSA